MGLRELMEKRANLVSQARALVDKAEAEKRELSEIEQTTYTQIMTDVAKIKGEVKRAEQLEEEERQLGESAHTPIRPEPNGQPADDKAQQQRGAAWRTFLANGPSGLRAQEVRALQADLDASGGYLVAPTEWRNQLIKGIDNLVYVRQLAAVQPPMPSATSLGVPTLETDMGDPTWTSELQVGNEDNNLNFGKRELTPKPLARYIKVSNKLRRAAMMNVEAIVRERLAYKFATVQENAFFNGSGAGQPLGMMVASDDGVPTSRDISTGNTATAVTADGLLSAFYGIKPQYRRSGVWFFHTDVLLSIAKLKDGENRYIWQPGLSADAPDTIKGRPVYESAYMPNTMTANLYVGMFADLRVGYWIVDALQAEVQVLTELFALTNQTAYVGRLECDGMPVLAEAFARVKLGS